MIWTDLNAYTLNRSDSNVFKNFLERKQTMPAVASIKKNQTTSLQRLPRLIKLAKKKPDKKIRQQSVKVQPRGVAASLRFQQVCNLTEFSD